LNAVLVSFLSQFILLWLKNAGVIVSMDDVFSQAVSHANSLTSQAARKENAMAIVIPNIKIAVGETVLPNVINLLWRRGSTPH
jgi:hypothetical protein